MCFLLFEQTNQQKSKSREFTRVLHFLLTLLTLKHSSGGSEARRGKILGRPGRFFVAQSFAQRVSCVSRAAGVARGPSTRNTREAENCTQKMRHVKKPRLNKRQTSRKQRRLSNSNVFVFVVFFFLTHAIARCASTEKKGLHTEKSAASVHGAFRPDPTRPPPPPPKGGEITNGKKKCKCQERKACRGEKCRGRNASRQKGPVFSFFLTFGWVKKLYQNGSLVNGSKDKSLIAPAA